MNTARILINQVMACGGRVSLNGDKLHMSAPKPLPDKLIEKLKANKPTVMEYLRSNQKNAPKDHAINPLPLIPKTTRSPFDTPADPQDWHGWIKQRRNKILFEGRLTWLEICREVYAEAVEAWCGQYWNPPSHCRCAVCDKPDAEFNCGDGATVCRQDDYSCLIEYGTRRKRDAVKGLSQIGIEVPEGWALPDGSTP